MSKSLFFNITAGQNHLRNGFSVEKSDVENIEFLRESMASAYQQAVKAGAKNYTILVPEAHYHDAMFILKNGYANATKAGMPFPFCKVSKIKTNYDEALEFYQAPIEVENGSCDETRW